MVNKPVDNSWWIIVNYGLTSEHVWLIDCGSILVNIWYGLFEHLGINLGGKPI